MTTGWKPRIFGYMSSGEMVPEVMMTLLYRSNTGLIASAGSRHLYCNPLSASHTDMQTGHGLHKMEDRIWYGGMFRFVGLQDEQEPCAASAPSPLHLPRKLTSFIRGYKRCKRRNLLQRMVFIEIREFQCPDK